jgi:hypothetical protein
MVALCPIDIYYSNNILWSWFLVCQLCDTVKRCSIIDSTSSQSQILLFIGVSTSFFTYNPVDMVCIRATDWSLISLRQSSLYFNLQRGFSSDSKITSWKCHTSSVKLPRSSAIYIDDNTEHNDIIIATKFRTQITWRNRKNNGKYRNRYFDCVWHMHEKY